MKKYLGLVKCEEIFMGGCNIKIKSRFYDSREEIQQWMKLFPETYSKLIFENTSELEEFFEVFTDYTPITLEEHESTNKAKEMLRDLMRKEI